MDTLSKIMLKVKISEILHPVLKTPCWEWLGGTGELGYGVTEIPKKRWYVHRLMFSIRWDDAKHWCTDCGITLRELVIRHDGK